MRKIIAYLLLIILGLGIGILWSQRKTSSTEINTDGDVIIERIKAVKKVIVTEGYFSEVYNYKEAQKYFYNMISFEKKALLLVKGKVNISYDLQQMKYTVDQEQKLIKVTQIPKAELIIEPSVKYYDLQESTFNTFSAQDYNKLNSMAIKKLKAEVYKSDLPKQAEKSLENTLNEMQWVGKELGWKVILPKRT